MDIRAHRAKKNIVVSLACQIVTMICGIIIPKLILDAFGSEIYGATSSISQFLSYIALFEGGVGGVARAVLYKPLADGDTETISAVMTEIKRFFRIIAYVFVVYVLVIACSFKTISRLEVLDCASTFLLAVVIGISTFGQYFIGISNSILLQAAQKSYITNLVNIVGTIVNAALIVVLILFESDIVTVKLFSSIGFVMKSIVLWGYVRKKFCLHRMAKKEEKYLSQKWSGMGQHIAYFLHSNTDIVILTSFADLKAVAVYSVYNMIIVNIQSFAASFVSGMEALFGDMLAKKEHAQLNRAFNIYETIISFVAVVLFSITAVMILPFVRIYTTGVSDVNYEAPLFALLQILSALVYCLRMPYHALVIAAGHFRQTQVAAYGEASINVALSVLLVQRFGLAGVAVGTLVATVFRWVYYVIYLSRRILRCGVLVFVKRISVNAAAFFIAFLIGTKFIGFFKITSYGIWAMCGALTAAIALLTCATANMLSYRGECAKLIRWRNKVK